MSTLFLCLLASSRRPFRALKMRPVRQEAVHSLWSRLFCAPLKTHSVRQVLFCGPLKMRRVPEKAVFGTEYPFCTVEACFLHRMLLKMRRVPQEAFLSTARIFRTIGGRFRYRVLSQRQAAAAAELRAYKERGRPFSRPLVVLYRHEPRVWNAAQAVELRNRFEIILLQSEL